MLHRIVQLQHAILLETSARFGGRSKKRHRLAPCFKRVISIKVLGLLYARTNQILKNRRNIVLTVSGTNQITGNHQIHTAHAREQYHAWKRDAKSRFASCTMRADFVMRGRRASRVFCDGERNAYVCTPSESVSAVMDEPNRSSACSRTSSAISDTSARAFTASARACRPCQ